MRVLKNYKLWKKMKEDVENRKDLNESVLLLMFICLILLTADCMFIFRVKHALEFVSLHPFQPWQPTSK